MNTTDLRTPHLSALAVAPRPDSVLRQESLIPTGTRGFATTVTAPAYRTAATAPCSTNATSFATNVWSPIEHKAMAKHDRWPLYSTS